MILTPDGEKVIDCDSVVLSVGYVPGTSLVKESSEHVHILGEQAKVRNLKNVSGERMTWLSVVKAGMS